MHTLLLSLAAFSSISFGVSALEITNPVPGIVWNSTGIRTVTWVNLPDDPSEFSMYLIDYETDPPETILISAQVTTSADSYTFDTALPNGTVALEFTEAENSTDVLCESGQFSVAIGGPQGCSTCTGVASSTTAPSTTSDVSAGGTILASATGTGSTQTGSSTGSVSKSSAVGTYEARGYGIAVGMAAVVLAAMVFVA